MSSVRTTVLMFRPLARACQCLHSFQTHSPLSSLQLSLAISSPTTTLHPCNRIQIRSRSTLGDQKHAPQVFQELIDPHATALESTSTSIIGFTSEEKWQSTSKTAMENLKKNPINDAYTGLWIKLSVFHTVDNIMLSLKVFKLMDYSKLILLHKDGYIL